MEIPERIPSNHGGGSMSKLASKPTDHTKKDLDLECEITIRVTEGLYARIRRAAVMADETVHNFIVNEALIPCIESEERRSY
jgi:hypothetical protein